MSNVPNWGQVRADFNNSGRMLEAAQRGISSAGTVFGQMRKDILDREQQAIDNAYRESALNEQIRQFGVTDALNQAKLAEDVRQADLVSADKGLDRTQRENESLRDYRARMAAVGAQNSMRQLQAQALQMQMEDRLLQRQRDANFVNSLVATNADINNAKAQADMYKRALGSEDVVTESDIANYTVREQALRDRANITANGQLLNAALASGDPARITKAWEEQSAFEMSRAAKAAEIDAERSKMLSKYAREDQNTIFSNLGKITNPDASRKAWSLMDDIEKEIKAGRMNRSDAVKASFMISGEDTNFSFNPSTSNEDIMDNIKSMISDTNNSNRPAYASSSNPQSNSNSELTLQERMDLIEKQTPGKVTKARLEVLAKQQEQQEREFRAWLSQTFSSSSNDDGFRYPGYNADRLR